jgi:hypothetical protein
MISDSCIKNSISLNNSSILGEAELRIWTPCYIVHETASCLYNPKLRQLTKQSYNILF